MQEHRLDDTGKKRLEKVFKDRGYAAVWGEDDFGIYGTTTRGVAIATRWKHWIIKGMPHPERMPGGATTVSD